MSRPHCQLQILKDKTIGHPKISRAIGRQVGVRCGVEKFARAGTAEEFTPREKSWPLSLPVAELIND